MTEIVQKPTPGTSVDDMVHSIRVTREVSIEASVEIVFESILEELGPGSQMPDGSPFPMKLEAWPGGRLYRDLGNNTGHLWGHVQVIKPPKLLEISGPLFMSYPAINFLQYRVTAEGTGAKLSLIHRAMGQIPADHRESVSMGWEHALKRIAEIAAQKAGR